MRPRLAQLHDSGAADNQGVVFDATSGLWVPQSVVLTVNGSSPDAAGNVAVSGSAHTVADEGTAVTQRGTLDFQGAGVTVTDDAANSKTIVTIPGGGEGGGTTVNDRRWVRGSTAHAQDDEFNDGSLAAAWGRVDEASSAAAATWTEGGDSLSLLLDGGDSAAELHAMMRPYALAVGEAVQCHVTGVNLSDNYLVSGLIVANGNTYGAGLQEALVWFQNLNTLSPAEWSGYNSRTAYTDVASSFYGNSFHLRLKRSATNTYQHFFSPDGISWVKLGGDRTQTMTPSHVGVFGTTWGGTSDMMFAFDYFRVI